MSDAIPDEFKAMAKATFLAVCNYGGSERDFIDDIARALMAADEAATKRERERDKWQPIETAPEGQTVLATYQNSHKKWRTIKAVRYDKYSREASDSDDLEKDYDEESDGHYWQAGWYEIIENWDDYTHIVVNLTPTHWMPLSAPPILKGEA